MVNPYKIPSLSGAVDDDARERAFRRLSDKALVELKEQFRQQLSQVIAELDRRSDRLTIPQRAGAA